MIPPKNYKKEEALEYYSEYVIYLIKENLLGRFSGKRWSLVEEYSLWEKL